MGWIPVSFFLLFFIQGHQIATGVSTNFYNFRPSTSALTSSSNYQRPGLNEDQSPVRNPNHPTDLRAFNNRKAYGSKTSASSPWPSTATASRYLTGPTIPNSSSRPHQFMDRNDDDNTYHWGYDTGSSFHYNKSFREERRDSYGRVWGKYGFVDNDGLLHIVEYVADEGGYRTRTRNRFYLDSGPSGPPPSPPRRPTSSSGGYQGLGSSNRFKPLPRSRTDIIRRQSRPPPPPLIYSEEDQDDYQY